MIIFEFYIVLIYIGYKIFYGYVDFYLCLEVLKYVIKIYIVWVCWKFLYFLYVVNGNICFKFYKLFKSCI